MGKTVACLVTAGDSSCDLCTPAALALAGPGRLPEWQGEGEPAVREVRLEPDRRWVQVVNGLGHAIRQDVVPPHRLERGDSVGDLTSLLGLDLVAVRDRSAEHDGAPALASAAPLTTELIPADG
jgi:hypothetical protein